LCVGTPARHGRAAVAQSTLRSATLICHAVRYYMEPSSSLPIVQLVAPTASTAALRAAGPVVPAACPIGE
ncbi:MAG TPA: hypothetical protein VIV12_26330, partial [Streptosporangiaceae bacterium]